MARFKTPSFVLELKLNTSGKDRDVLDLRFSYGCRIYNTLIRHCRKQLTKLGADRRYKELLMERISTKNDRRRVMILDKTLSDIRKDYGLTEYGLHAFVVEQQHRYKRHIDSNTAQKIATEAWTAVSRYLFGNGKSLHFRRQEDFLSMEGKNNSAGMRYKDGRLHWNGLVIQPRLKKKDSYATAALKSRVKYCRITRRVVGSTCHYYLQLILEGTPPAKHETGAGRCGIDIGPSTTAIVTDSCCDLSVLGENVKRHEKEIRILNRKLDRSRRAMNPENYNPDGTVKRGRKKWRYSHTYLMTVRKKHSLQRKAAASIKLSHNRKVNGILAVADEIYVERMDMAGLSERTKETTYNARGRIKSKQRYGKSIGNHAPSLFISILERKLSYSGKELNKVDTWEFRASQYNHADDTYTKKQLDKRSTRIEGYLVQRDLYSAFLLMNSCNDNKKADRTLCVEGFKRFLSLHDACIQSLLRNTSTQYPSSFGLSDFA